MTDIGKAYGNALYLLSTEEGVDGRIMEELSMVCQIIGQEPEFARLMSTPTLKKAKRIEVLNETFGGRTHDFLLSFMCILVENNTFEELPMCLEEYERLYNKAHGILVVTAVTAVPLSDELQASLIAKLEKSEGKTIRLKNVVDPKYIGGVRLEMDGNSLDGSVKSRFEAIKSNLFGIKA